MADYLVVIDMQTDYLDGRKSYDCPSLTTAVNERIENYPSDRVIYVLNRFFWEFSQKPKQLAAGVSLVSEQVFEKRRGSCFTNKALKRFLQEKGAKSLEIIGLDGNACVNSSIQSAIKEGYRVTVDLSAIGVTNVKAFQKTLKNWENHRVIVKEKHYR